MKMKKIISMFLVGLTAVSLLAGCSSDSGNSSGDASDETTQSADQGEDAEAESQDEADNTSDDASGSGNVLVVYYSATGNTEEAANMIADATGGDIFELEPVEPYTDDDLNYSDENSRVSREHEDESLKDVELVSTTVDNWDSYDTVFIGYPKLEQGFTRV